MRFLFFFYFLICIVFRSEPTFASNVVVAEDDRYQSQTWQQRFVDNAGVRIEYRVRESLGGGASIAPIVFIPGMAANASDWEKNTALIAALDKVVPRKLIAISLRGRGASDCPESGWTPLHHQSDIAAVIRAENLKQYHVIAHSMGVAYGIGFALHRPQGEILSFTAGDYFPAVQQVTESWASMVESSEPPLAYDPRMARHVLREQGAEDYADRLGELQMPILVLFGKRSMEQRAESLYVKAPHHHVIWFDHGHRIFSHPEAIDATVVHLGMH